MGTKIFLEGYNSKKSVNTSEGLNVNLKGKRKLLPTNDVGEVISQFDQYREERKNCNIIRLTCQVNPICSNVLFNRVSEIVRDEGSSDITYINYGILRGTQTDDSVDYGNDEDKKVKYKNNLISFWKDNVLVYQSIDNALNGLGPDIPLQVAVSRYNGYTSNTTVTSSITTKHPTNAIRDMQLSNCGYVYHCGLDIFNNHLIRSNSFKCVCKMPDTFTPESYNAFNTIADLMRDINGDKVVEKIIFPENAGILRNMKFIPMHLYKYDDVYTYEECIENRLLDSFNGWVGFNNKPKIKTYEVFSIDHMENEQGEEKELHIERPIMYLNGGDFVDMYPDRSLYSFVPKYNHFRNRIEKNWNYCLTYPSSSTTSGFEDIIETSNNSLKAIYFDENTKADNGVSQLVIYSIAKHGLAEGDEVNIYINTTDDEGKITNRKIIDNAKVVAVVDEYIFTIFNADTQISKSWVEVTIDDFKNGEFVSNGVTYKIEKDKKRCSVLGADNRTKYYYIINERYVNLDDDAQNISYKKVVNDIECEYYVRIFSKIPNFKNASVDTSNEYQLYKNNAEIIDIYQDHKYDFESHVSRLAFAKNIYTDEVGEVVFTDDIDISNLHDNLGRPLSSIYLTIIKNNKGYKEWYGFDCTSSWSKTQICSENVEYSHCFGRVTCGIETSNESTTNKALSSIYTISNNANISHGFGFDVNAINGLRSYGTYAIGNTEVWFDTDKHYYGDLCYYDNYNAIERSIQPIMHRFNTAQRESSQADSWDYYDTYVYDEIAADDYDTDNAFLITASTVTNANRKDEGYYYNPHYEIRLKTFDKIQTIFPDMLTIRSFVKVGDDGNTYRVTVLENHYLTAGDKSVIYDKVNNCYYYCTTVTSDDDTYKTFTCKIYGEHGEEITDLPNMFNGDENFRNYRLFKMDNLNIPSYATILKDGSCRVIWRNILNNGFNMADDTVEEYPFTNGAFYINRRIDLFVRRQDPFGMYGLRSDDLVGLGIETENDNYVKDKEIEC